MLEESIQSTFQSNLPSLLEAIILAAGRPISEEEILKLFPEEEKPSKKDLRDALKCLQESCESRGITLVEMASGYQFQVKVEWGPIIARLWEEKSPKYSRALLETLALVAYRQPITRGEIEDIRGVSLSLSIFKTLLEDREWIRVVGHREVPGRPALYATTKNFLDYFGLKSLEELPTLPDIMNLDSENSPEMAFAALQQGLANIEEGQSIDSELESDEKIGITENQSLCISEIEADINDHLEDENESETSISIMMDDLLDEEMIDIDTEEASDIEFEKHSEIENALETEEEETCALLENGEHSDSNEEYEDWD